MAQNFEQYEIPEPEEPELPIVPIPGGATLQDGEFKSPNFVTTQRGWRIDSDGNAEFNRITLRGIPDVQTFTASGTWTKPANGEMALIQAWGAGGSGGRGTDTNQGGGGGGGGAYVERWMPVDDLTATVAVTIGAGGASVNTSNTAGNAGGNTTFGSVVTAYGGGKGGNGAAAGVGIIPVS